jgi:guanine deaminase
VTDSRFLERAIELACDGASRGLGGPFGAVVVREGVVLGEGSNEVVLTKDPTAHAEIVAIRRACASLQHFSLSGATIYASCEPCPMCLGAIHWARLDVTYFAATRDEAARAGFDDAAFHRELALPAASRRVRSEHVAIDGAERPFVVWKSSPLAVAY